MLQGVLNGKSAMDPGFPKEALTSSWRGARKAIIWPNFTENCVKMKTFEPRGVRPKFYYVDPSL